MLKGSIMRYFKLKTTTQITYSNTSLSYLNLLLGMESQVKCIPQVKPPLTIGDSLYVNVCGLIISTIGHTTVWLSFVISKSNGSSHPLFTSQWLSRNSKTSPVAFLAAADLPLISPIRSLLCSTWPTEVIRFSAAGNSWIKRAKSVLWK